MNATNEIIKDLKELYKEMPFSVGLHTTNKESARAILKTGLKTGARVVEGTIKFRGDLNQVSEKDLDYFFPYTDHTVIVAIPKVFDAPRIEDNKGGNESLCEFSEFFENAQLFLPHYSDGLVGGVLPNYYILGYYDKEFKVIYNQDCMLFNKVKKEQFKKDVEVYENFKVL